MRARGGLVALVLAWGCAPPPVQPPVAEMAAPLAPPAPPPDPAPAESGEERAIAAMLGKVARLHALTALRVVPGKVVTRDEGIRLIIAKTERDLPKQVMQAQGELYSALELAPADYPFVDGMFEMVKKNIAGFYDPEDDTMYLLDDLDEAGRDRTLAHELVHALQDQHFDLGGRLKYRRGRLDELAAESCMAEGDAMSAMFDEAYGEGVQISADALRFDMMASVTLSETGPTTPRALEASLVAPYVDGYRFIQELRDQGGWDLVNRAWKAPPSTTEQVLHPEKYDRAEPALDVAVPGAAALGKGYELIDADVNGEQGLRIAFEQWAPRRAAAEAAAGWGGDRYAVYARDGAEGREIAVAWTIRFDSPTDADEAEKLVNKRLGRCHVRDPLGPIAWRRKGDALAIVAGPYRRVAGKAASAKADCRLAEKWLREIIGK